MPFLNVLINWYSKCFAYVRWGSFVSSTFQIFAGDRQGGVLSPSLYAVFIDSVISKLRAAGLGTRIGQFFFSCLLYADDILLVSHSLHELQAMLDLCAKEAADLDFTLNAKKSVVLRIGPNYNYACVPLTLYGAALSCVDQCKYLGIVLTSSRNFKCSLFACSFV